MSSGYLQDLLCLMPPPLQTEEAKPTCLLSTMSAGTNNNAALLEGLKLSETPANDEQFTLKSAIFDDLKDLEPLSTIAPKTTHIQGMNLQTPPPFKATIDALKDTYVSAPNIPSFEQLNFKPLSEDDKQYIIPMKYDLPGIKLGRQVATALGTRTDKEVHAALKRPLRDLETMKTRSHKKKSSEIAKWVESVPEDSHFDEQEEYEQDEDDGDDDNGDDDDEDDVAPVAKPKKISERQRRMAAIADNHMLSSLQKSLNDGLATVKAEDEVKQSARWMVNQSESHNIISTPRVYQTELFERAKESNVIAVLDTGSGKTLIAVLLLRHTFAQELEDRALGKGHRVSFFLVDSVTLAFQQHAVLKANLDQPMNFFCGDMSCDLWSKDVWNKHMKENMVIVCTAEVLRHCLARAFITMNQINLLIFDEAHHAKKSHPYARIILDFYAQLPKEVERPKIFGMTASPVDARTDVKKAAHELETILHSQIVTAEDGSLSGFKITSKQEHLAKYASLGVSVKTPLCGLIYDRFKSNLIMKKPLAFAIEASRELGVWCSDQVWPFCLGEEESKRLLAKTERLYHGKKVQEPLEVLEARKKLIMEAREIVNAHPYEQPDFRVLPDGTAHSNNLSSKVTLLVQYLQERFERKTDDKAIVFVKQRYTARLLARLFSCKNIRTDYLNVGTLVGTTRGNAGDMRVSFRDQVVTMMNFRKGKINCLFATSVAEEGLDIPDCNLVIRFDLYDTLIQYIQSRGRARQANSRYIHMYEDGNQDHSSIIREVRRNEDILDRFCQALPDDRKLFGNKLDIDYFLAKEKSHRVYVVPETGAKLTYRISLMVLSTFVDSLPHGPESILTAEFVMICQNKQFICEVILPEVSPIRGAAGRPAATKAVAKCSAAFETCLLLRKGKYIDENLLPVFTKQLPAMRNALLAVDSKKREAFSMRTKPEMWSILGTPSELFVTILSLRTPECLGRPSQPLALLTRTAVPNLPPFLLHFGSGQNSQVVIISLDMSLKVDASVLQEINTFTLRIFDDVFSKGYESDPAKMPYFLAPVNAGTAYVQQDDPMRTISWDILSAINVHEKKWAHQPWEDHTWREAPDDYFNNRYIVDPYDGSRKLWGLGVAHQYKPLDSVPPNTAPRPGPRKNNSNIMEYSSSLWAKARARRNFDEHQRVIEAELISLRRNLLDPYDTSNVETPKKCYVIIEPLKISPIPTPVVAMAYLFPAIIHRVESYLIALEACAILHLDVRPDLALEALTKYSDNSGEHGSEVINFQRGMGNNYERLEFLGDCFLKMATSISLYGIHPDSNEYAYHVDRMCLICNKNLRNNAVKLKLYEYIRSQAFNRRAWYPEGLVLVKGKTAKAPDSQKLGDKTIADVCEALIGAALLSTGDMDNAVRAVTELVSSDNHRATCYGDYYKLYQKPRYQTAPATEAHRWLAEEVEKKHSYHFKYPRLVRSAFIHPSYPFSYERIPSYQRLEFLGDALLDMACINFLFHGFPGKDPQWLTEHKMAMVSNQFLGALCVHLDLQKHLLIFNASYQTQITDYVTDIQEARRQAEEDAEREGKSKEDCNPDYWTSVRQPPKCLPDVVEAYVGAVFVDSEYEYSEVERFFDEHMRWFFRDMSVYDSYANKQPTTFLTKFLQINMGCVDWSVIPKEIPNIDGSKPQIMCMIIIHDKVVSEHTSDSSRYAKVNAAKKAVSLLEGLPLPEFREKYGCDCRIEATEGLDEDDL